MNEPLLRAEDYRAWDAWMKVVWLHRRSLAFRRAVDQARRVTEQALASATKPSVSCSGGKDSIDLAHLVGVLCGGKHAVVHSEKDDLDFPGEEAYVQRWASEWGLDLRILRPPISPRAWLEQHAGGMSGMDDVHGQLAALSKACFYPVMRAADEGHDLVFLGLRAEESRVRRILRARRGLTYDLKGYADAHPGERQVRCNPLADWRGIDVYAYAEEHGIELLPVYRCIGWLPEHRAKPWLVRKAWWLPGSHAANGQAAWLKHYWPSLYEVYVRLFGDARSFS